MMYIWAWQAAPLQPSAWMVSRIAAAAGERQAGAAVFLRDQRGEIAGLGERGDELGGIAALGIQLAPVFAGKAGAELAHFLADLGVRVGLGRVVHAYCLRPWD